MKETKAKINETKSLFFEKINKINCYPDSSRKKGKRIKLINQKGKWRNHNRQHRNAKDNKRPLSKPYANKMNNLEEIDKVLEKYNLSKLNQKEIKNPNRPTTSREIETVIKSLPTNKIPGWLHR